MIGSSPLALLLLLDNLLLQQIGRNRIMGTKTWGPDPVETQTRGRRQAGAVDEMRGQGEKAVALTRREQSLHTERKTAEHGVPMSQMPENASICAEIYLENH